MFSPHKNATFNRRSRGGRPSPAFHWQQCLHLAGDSLGGSGELLGVDLGILQDPGDHLVVLAGAELHAGHLGGAVRVHQGQNGLVLALHEELLELVDVHLGLLALVAVLHLGHLAGVDGGHALQDVAELVVGLDGGLVLLPQLVTDLLPILLLLESAGHLEVVVGVGVDQVVNQAGDLAAAHVIDGDVGQGALMQLDGVERHHQLLQGGAVGTDVRAILLLEAGHGGHNLLVAALEQLLDDLLSLVLAVHSQAELAEQGLQILPQELDAGLAGHIQLVVVDEDHDVGGHDPLLVLLAGDLLRVDHVDDQGHAAAQVGVLRLLGLVQVLDGFLDHLLGLDVAGHDAVDDILIGEDTGHPAVPNLQAVVGDALALAEGERSHVVVLLKDLAGFALFQHEYHVCFLLV